MENLTIETLEEIKDGGNYIAVKGFENDEINEIVSELYNFGILKKRDKFGYSMSDIESQKLIKKLIQFNDFTKFKKWLEKKPFPNRLWNWVEDNKIIGGVIIGVIGGVILIIVGKIIK